MRNENENAQGTWMLIPQHLVIVGDEVGWGGKRVLVLGLGKGYETGRRFFVVGCPKTYEPESDEMKLSTSARAGRELRYFGHRLGKLPYRQEG